MEERHPQTCDDGSDGSLDPAPTSWNLKSAVRELTHESPLYKGPPREDGSGQVPSSEDGSAGVPFIDMAVKWSASVIPSGTKKEGDKAADGLETVIAGTLRSRTLIRPI